MTLTLTIPDASLPSWNTVMRMHFQQQHEVQQAWMTLAINALQAQETTFVVPVDVCITSYQKGRMIDPDNLYVKGVLDGLKKRLFPDDSPRWIDSVQLRSRKAKANRVEVVVTPT